MKLLPNTHVSPETAYIVENYPYGFKLRTTIRYWIHVDKTHGARPMSQTINPKTGKWNKEKAGTYCNFGMAMYLDDEDHVQFTGLHEYMDNKETQDWLSVYLDSVPDSIKKVSIFWGKAKQKYEDQKNAA